MYFSESDKDELFLAKVFKQCDHTVHQGFLSPRDHVPNLLLQFIVAIRAHIRDNDFFNCPAI